MTDQVINTKEPIQPTEQKSKSQNTENSVSPRRTTRSRFSRQPRAGMRLESRDVELLANLFLHQAMSRGQIQTLYFNSVVRCNARLRQLFDHNYVSRYYLPAAPFGAQAIYSIGKAAIPLVSKQLDLEVAEIQKRYRRAKTPTFIEHTLEIVNTLIAFKKVVAERPDIELERWVPEYLCRHEYEIRANEAPRWVKEVFKPDAFIRLKQLADESYHSFFIEVDMGHTSSSQFLAKLATHERYLESGLFNQLFGGDQFKTLVITTTPGRLRNLRALVEKRDSSLFWFTTYLEIQEKDIIDSIWQVPNCLKRFDLLCS